MGLASNNEFLDAIAQQARVLASARCAVYRGKTARIERVRGMELRKTMGHTKSIIEPQQRIDRVAQDQCV